MRSRRRSELQVPLWLERLGCPAGHFVRATLSCLFSYNPRRSAGYHTKDGRKSDAQLRRKDRSASTRDCAPFDVHGRSGKKDPQTTFAAFSLIFLVLGGQENQSEPITHCAAQN